MDINGANRQCCDLDIRDIRQKHLGYMPTFVILQLWDSLVMLYML